MAEVEVELRRMVQAFRITELQVLLGYSGKQKTGKKQELMERAMTLLRNPSYQLVSKIRELHSQRTNRVNGNHVPRNPHPQQVPSYHQPSPDPVSAYKSETKVVEEENVRHDLSLEPLPFYDHISQILPPTPLRQTSFGNRYQEVLVTFSLSPQHAREITTNRSVGSGGIFSSDVQAQLRFAPIGKETRNIKDMYPPCLVLRLNGKIIQLPNPIPTNKQNADPKRPPRPLDLTWSCRLSPMVQNSLLICWALPNEPDIPKEYCYTINLVKKRSAEYLADKVVAKGIRPKKQTDAMIKAKLSDSEDDIALTSLKVSLLCPLGKMRMTLPCCPTTCDHIQCFDAKLYIMMNEKKPTWNCPVCDAPAKFTDLLIDELFSEICKEADDCDEILFSPDGSWAPLGPAGKDAQTIGPHGKMNGQHNSQRPPPSHSQDKKVADECKEKADIDIIVLSDSEDEQEVISDNGSSIQPVRANKRPISAISSDSSLDLNSAPSSTNGNLLPSLPTTHSQSHHPPRMPTSNPHHSSYNSDGLHGSGLNSYNLLDSMNPSSVAPPTSSTHSFAHYPLFMPTHQFDYPSSTFSSHSNLFPMIAPQDLSSRSTGLRLPSHPANISDPTIIDFSPNRFSDSPLLDDSDIIPLD